MKLNLDNHNARVSAFKANRADKGLVGALKCEGGAIDLASIMVGVLVIGIIGGVIAATVFAVIPWSQDKAASQALDSVATAQSVAYTFAAGEGTSKYFSESALNTGTGLSATNEPLLQASPAIAIQLGAGDITYTAYSKSATGTVFKITSANPTTVVKMTPAEVTAAAITF